MPVTNVPLNIRLHSTQQFIHDNSRKYTVIRAGKRFGKTKLALYRALQKASHFPNGTVWYLAPTFRMAKSIAWRELLQILPPQMIRRKVETDLLIELWNGCLFQLIGCDNEDHLRGVKINHYVLDEAAYIKDYVKSILDGQLLGNVESGTFDVISSPNRTGKNWFSAFWEDAKKKMDAGDPEWAAFHFDIYSNPTIPKKDIDKLKDNTSDDTWNLEYLAIESAFAGQMYHEFNYDVHVAEFIPDQKQIYAGVDWGWDHPTALLFSYVKDGKVWVYDEFSRSGMLIKEICSVMKDKCANKDVQWVVIDPSANRTDQVTGRSVKDEFSRNGIGCIDGDRRGGDTRGGRGTDCVKLFFKSNKIVIHPRCKNLIAELRNLQWGDKISDDMTDCLRYMLLRFHDTHKDFSAGNVFPSAVTPKSATREMRIDNLVITGASPKGDMSWAWGEEAA